MKPLVTHDRLKELLSYDPETGIFTWKVTRGWVKAGDEAGSVFNNDYVRIGIDEKFYKRSRLAWFYVHGVWPKELIDHKNGVKSDDRLSNLREATKAENNRNAQRFKKNATGLRGVHWRKNIGRWEARIRNGNGNIYLGYFQTKEEAHKAYCEASAKLHGEFSCLNRL